MAKAITNDDVNLLDELGVEVAAPAKRGGGEPARDAPRGPRPSWTKTKREIERFVEETTRRLPATRRGARYLRRRLLLRCSPLDRYAPVGR